MKFNTLQKCSINLQATDTMVGTTLEPVAKLATSYTYMSGDTLQLHISCHFTFSNNGVT